MAGVDLAKYKRMVQGFFDPEPRNDRAPDNPIWCLGVKYDSQQQSPSNQPPSTGFEHSPQTNGDHDHEVHSESIPVVAGVKDHAADWPVGFLDDHEARFWITYRSNMPPIAKSLSANVTLSVRLRNWTDKDGFTSDTGWGCMIRSGQSLLANSLSILKLGRDWQRGQNPEKEKLLLSYFADYLAAPFSIHKFVEHGAQACGTHPGEWFGPSATARCIQALAKAFEPTQLGVYVNADGAGVYQDQVFRIAKAQDATFTPVLILLGVRLGIDHVTPAYWDALKYYLRLSQSVGIAGGRPSSSHYFIAYQGDDFFYLDPHFTRPAVPFHQDPQSYSHDEVDSYHTRRLRRLNLSDIDPSMLLAFLIQNEEDWKVWRAQIDAFGGRSIVQVTDHEPPLHGQIHERPGAIDEVETFDDDDGEDDA